MNKKKTLLLATLFLSMTGLAYAEPVVTIHLSYNNSVEVDYISTTNSTPDLHESGGSLKFVLSSEEGEPVYSQKSGLPYQTILTEGGDVERSLAETQRVNLPYIEGSEKIHIYKGESKIGEYDIPQEGISPMPDRRGVEEPEKNRNSNNLEIGNYPFPLLITPLFLLITIVAYLSVVPES